MFLINLNAEIVACILSFRKSKLAPQAKSAKYFQIWFSPRFGGKKWRRSEHAHASYPGLFFRPPGFSPYMGREERRVQELDYLSSRSPQVLIHFQLPRTMSAINVARGLTFGYFIQSCKDKEELLSAFT